MDVSTGGNHYIFGDLLYGDSFLYDYFKNNGRYIYLRPRTFIISQGRIPDGLYLMDSGIVERSAVSASGSRKIFSLHMGHFIAGITSIDNTPSVISYQCLTVSGFYTVSLSSLPGQDRRFLSGLFKYLTYEMGLLQNQLRLETVCDSTQNIFRIIDEFDEIKRNCKADDHFVLTHQIIADMIGRTREQVTNIISRGPADGLS